MSLGSVIRHIRQVHIYRHLSGSDGRKPHSSSEFNVTDAISCMIAVRSKKYCEIILVKKSPTTGLKTTLVEVNGVSWKHTALTHIITIQQLVAKSGKQPNVIRWWTMQL